ncbi:MAG: phosphoglycerate kinase [Candidatus Delongbacteria bacterium]|nr:phosphoglycerate kinase [Candidatus Delongbacteria bacterium]
MAKRTIDQIDLKNKRVLMRVDFNVPLHKTTKAITDDNRIVEALPSIKKVIQSGGKLVLMSHLGKPKGEKNPDYTLAPVARRLGELLGQSVAFAADCVGDDVLNTVNALKPGEVLLLENLRFHKEEEKNDPGFAEQLAKLGDVYINDAFGTAHRAHASTEGVIRFIKESALGYLMEKEVRYLEMAISDPKRPYMAILGGAKVSDKIEVITNLMEKVDTIFIGGGMIFTFFKAMGLEVGKSLLEADKVEVAKQIMEKAKTRNIKLILPVDIEIADNFAADANHRTVDRESIPADWMGLDIGPRSVKLFADELKDAKTVVWNGPMGVFEMEAFAKGTVELARIIAEVTQRGAVSIIGGGDSAAAIAKAGVKDKITHISTGGGASLEFLEGKKLPGIEAVSDL